MNIVPSLTEKNTYFLFRDKGVEIKILLSGKKIFASHGLHYKERQHINRYYLKNKTSTLYKKLNELNNEELKEVELKVDKLLKMKQ